MEKDRWTNKTKVKSMILKETNREKKVRRKKTRKEKKKWREKEAERQTKKIKN